LEIESVTGRAMMVMAMVMVVVMMMMMMMVMMFNVHDDDNGGDDNDAHNSPKLPQRRQQCGWQRLHMPLLKSARKFARS